MQSIQWTIRLERTPEILRHCKKCGQAQRFISSDLFRINAQHHRLDIWLIYRCATCESTWKLEIHNRVHPKALDPALYDRYLNNDPAEARRCALDRSLLEKNGATVCAESLAFVVEGPDVCLATLAYPVALTLYCESPLGIPVSRVLRQKMSLSRKTYEAHVSAGSIRCEGLDVKRMKLREAVTLALCPPTADG